ncbi:hypothetical protein MSAN_02294600 [Mycena sanguinolenta]|uniref:Uncharacterized protein n=1 Tax=Mycena sanguinolenta TaxID=230812 RepID=A0A8H7CGB7_9AGAR|nr:hypothetical protein MSAN_02294600 [Mycena sanguinolenta]
MDPKAPEDVWHGILAALSRVHPRSLEPLAWAMPETAYIVKQYRFRVLCVQSSLAAWKTRTIGFPALSRARFEALPRADLRWIRHLRIGAIACDALDPIFDGCPLMETLWIDHSRTGALAPAVRGLDRLHTLRELTIPFVYFTEGAWLHDVVVPTVTHLHLNPVANVDEGSTLHLPALSAFPNLTHLGFAGDPGCVGRAAQSNTAWGVLVRVHEDDELDGADVYVDPRVVYLRYRGLASEHDWLLRACPDWKPHIPRELPWDQWRCFDAIMAARKRGRLPAQSGPIGSSACAVLAEWVD